MKLTLERLKTITHGAVSVTEENGVFTFHRFTQLGEDYYQETSPRDFYAKTFATSGIKLDFITDSSMFALDYTVAAASSRQFYYLDVYLDGALKYHQGEQHMWQKSGHLQFGLKEGEHRVTVWFPCLSSCRVSNITLDDGSLIQPVTYPHKMLCFGDSITQGYDAEFNALTYANQIAGAFNCEMINQAIGGEKFVPGILDKELAKTFVPDIITVAYGTNDWSCFEADLFHSRCDAFLRGLGELYPTADVFVITPLWRADHHRITKAGSFESAVEFITKTAEKYGHHVINGYRLTPHYTAFYSDERLHPNDLGFCEYAKNLVVKMEEML